VSEPSDTVAVLGEQPNEEGLLDTLELPEQFKQEIQDLQAKKGLIIATVYDMMQMLRKAHEERITEWEALHKDMCDRIVLSVSDVHPNKFYYIADDFTVRVYESREAMAQAEGCEDATSAR